MNSPENTNMPTMDDYASEISQYKFYLSMAILMSGLMTIGVCGNCLVVIVVAKFPHMRSTTNLLLANLAINDLLTLLILIPIALAPYFAGRHWLFGKMLCYALDTIYWTTVCVSLFTLAIIATERYFAICHPLRVAVIFTKFRVLCAIGIVWSLAISISIPNIYIHDFVYNEFKKFSYCYPTKKTWYPEYRIGMDVVLLLPFVVIFLLYILICKTLFHSINSGDLQRSGDQLTKERKQVAKMIITVAVFLFICLPPERIFHVLNRNGYMIYMDVMTFRRLNTCFRALYLANSAVNPIIYSLMNSKFREVFARIIFPGRHMQIPCRNREQLCLETVGGAT